MLVCDISLTHKYGKQTLDAQLSPFHVCWQEMVVLMAAHRSPDVTSALLSRLLQTDKGNVNKLLNSMESKGLITRAPTQKDQRRKALRLASHKLSAVCAHFDIELNHHHAESDALAAARILLRLREIGLSDDVMKLK